MTRGGSVARGDGHARINHSRGAVDNPVRYGPRDGDDCIRAARGEVDRREASRLEDPAVQMPYDLGMRRQPRKPMDGPSSEVKMDDRKTLIPQFTPEAPSPDRISHPAPPVERAGLDASLSKQVHLRSRPLQEPGVDTVSFGVETLRQRTDNPNHARTFGLCCSENMEYLVSHYVS